MVWARTSSALAILGNAFASTALTGFEAKPVRKTYMAIVCGKLEGEGVVDQPVQGKAARSKWV